jgi:lipoprotein NlpD
MQNQTLQVQSGDKVKKGQVIATTGKNNFYFEMKKFETPITSNATSPLSALIER